MIDEFELCFGIWNMAQKYSLVVSPQYTYTTKKLDPNINTTSIGNRKNSD